MEGSSSHLGLPSLPSDICQMIFKRTPVEKLLEWTSVCKEWKEFIISDTAMTFRLYGPHTQPSTRNGPILVSNKRVSFRKGLATRLTTSLATYDGGVGIWQDRGDLKGFLENELFDGMIQISTSGGLFYKTYSGDRNDSALTVDICNPVTRRCFRRVHQSQLAHCRVDLQGERRSLLWGLIVENHLDKYQVILQNSVTVSEHTLSWIVVYNSSTRVFDSRQYLPKDIAGRVGDYIYSSTSRGGNLYFLTRDRAANAAERRSPRLIKYDGSNRSIGEIDSPLPRFVGKGEPALIQYKGDIMFLTRNQIQRKSKRGNTWVFFRLQEISNNTSWVRMKEMPLDVLATLYGKIEIVRCEGNGDCVYFFGAPKGVSTTRVLVHDFVRDDWRWLEDFQWMNNDNVTTLSCQLVSILPSFMTT